MADLTYSVDVNTGPAQRNLDQLNKRVDKLNSTFAGLKSALAGLAIGAAISNVIRLADGIQDVSDATGMAIQNILGFQQAVSLNGGTAEQATQSVLICKPLLVELCFKFCVEYFFKQILKASVIGLQNGVLCAEEERIITLQRIVHGCTCEIAN
jgi:hypothetical protein